MLGWVFELHDSNINVFVETSMLFVKSVDSQFWVIKHWQRHRTPRLTPVEIWENDLIECNQMCPCQTHTHVGHRKRLQSSRATVKKTLTLCTVLFRKLNWIIWDWVYELHDSNINIFVVSSLLDVLLLTTLVIYDLWVLFIVLYVQLVSEV